MADVVGWLGAAAALAAVLASLTWLGMRVRRRGTGGGIMGPVDEIYRPHAHQLRFEIEAHEQRMLPLTTPTDQ